MLGGQCFTIHNYWEIKQTKTIILIETTAANLKFPIVRKIKVLLHSDFTP